MKKILTVASILSVLMVSNAMAEGQHSLGISGSMNNTKTELRTENHDIINTEEKSDNNTGAGIFYKYTHNIGSSQKFYVEPEVFYDFSKYENLDNALTNDTTFKEKVEISPSLGIKLNAGYHINEKHDLYFGLGVQKINYDIKWTEPGYYSSVSGSQLATLVGVGYNYNINEKIALGLQYNTSYTEIDGPDKLTLTTGVKEQSVYEVSSSNVKISVSYKF